MRCKNLNYTIMYWSSSYSTVIAYPPHCFPPLFCPSSASIFTLFIEILTHCPYLIHSQPQSSHSLLKFSPTTPLLSILSLNLHTLYWNSHPLPLFYPSSVSIFTLFIEILTHWPSFILTFCPFNYHPLPLFNPFSASIFTLFIKILTHCPSFIHPQPQPSRSLFKFSPTGPLLSILSLNLHTFYWNSHPLPLFNPSSASIFTLFIEILTHCIYLIHPQLSLNLHTLYWNSHPLLLFYPSSASTFTLFIEIFTHCTPLISILSLNLHTLYWNSHPLALFYPYFLPL